MNWWNLDELKKWAIGLLDGYIGIERKTFSGARNLSGNFIVLLHNIDLNLLLKYGN